MGLVFQVSESRLHAFVQLVEVFPDLLFAVFYRIL